MNPKPISAAKGFAILLAAILVAMLAQVFFEHEAHQRTVEQRLNDTIPGLESSFEMSIEEKNELMEALLWMAPDAEVRHLDTLIKEAERNPQDAPERSLP